MWKTIDKVQNRITYAAQLGTIGCLVLVVIEHSSGGYPSEESEIRSESSTITFVPGVSMQPDTFGNIQLVPMAGYGRLPTDLSADLPPEPEEHTLKYE